MNIHNDIQNLRKKKENAHHLMSEEHIRSNNSTLTMKEKKSRENTQKEIMEYRNEKKKSGEIENDSSF